MSKDFFCKSWGDEKIGFTYEEALQKKKAVDEAYGVEMPNSMWNPAVIENEQAREGYRVFIESKNNTQL